ncbi:protein YkpC [Metabacillus fastidiosus]
MKDLSRRLIISLTLAAIILSGMSISLANMPEAPSNGQMLQVRGE